jgi:two-component system chemotaxis response regulator CheB
MSDRSPGTSENLRLDSRPRAARIEVIGICASAGGPAALFEVLHSLPAGFSTPILVVQHMTPGFLGGLAGWLDAEIAPPVGLAGHGDRLARGVWFAPDGAHLILEKTRHLSLDSTTVDGSHRPSGNMLLESLARVSGAAAVAVVLTGMGRDGADGLQAVAAAGGRTIAQDEQSSAIYGMPRVAAERGAKLVLTPSAIGEELVALDRERQR